MPTGDAPLTTSEWSTILLPTQVRLILDAWRYMLYFTICNMARLLRRLFHVFVVFCHESEFTCHYVATSFWRNDDVIIKLCVRWVALLPCQETLLIHRRMPLLSEVFFFYLRRFYVSGKRPVSLTDLGSYEAMSSEEVVPYPWTSNCTVTSLLLHRYWDNEAFSHCIITVVRLMKPTAVGFISLTTVIIPQLNKRTPQTS